MVHPLDPLTAIEISSISRTVKEALLNEGIKAFKFIQVELIPPSKVAVFEFLGISASPGTASKSSAPIDRTVEIDFVNPINGFTYNATLTFQKQAWKLVKYSKLAEGVHPQITPEELNQADEAVRRNPEVIRLAAEIGVSAQQIHADGWSIGFDDRFPKTKRLQQCLLFARYGPDENLYAHPLDFFPTLDSNTFEVLHIDFAAHRTGKDGALSALHTKPGDIKEDALKISGRDRIKPPSRPFEYLPDKSGINPRPDLKPLHISQPEGPSFKMIGDHEIEWQKWRMHVAFTNREGIAISTVTYNDNGTVRPIFYRLSLVEMVVPYAETSSPHPRKFAFDVGEYGMGTQANDLTLGCDCLGVIHYMPGNYITHSGEAITIKRAICIHEEDDGTLWKHTDYRPNGRSHGVRSRRLVISCVATVANYEYLFYYYFYQDGSVSFAVRLSGVLNVYVLAPGETPGPYGSIVAPQINAHFHQHIFSFRIDPYIDGLKNSVLETDIVTIDAPTGSAENWAGNGFTIKEQVIKESCEGGRAYDFGKDRRWTIINRNKLHYASGRPVGYGIAVRGASVDLFAKPDSWIAKRASFTQKTLWVVRDDESSPRFWPAGKYVPQTHDTPDDSVSNWCTGKENLDNEDLVLFLTIGLNHIPHPEQWPVMPVEKLEVTLKPIGFFEQNPALDVPGAKDTASVLAFGEVNGAETQGLPGGTGSCCS